MAGRLGHADGSTTMQVYASFLEQKDGEAAAIIGRIVAGELVPVTANDDESGLAPVSRIGPLALRQ